MNYRLNLVKNFGWSIGKKLYQYKNLEWFFAWFLLNFSNLRTKYANILLIWFQQNFLGTKSSLCQQFSAQFSEVKNLRNKTETKQTRKTKILFS